jgi:ABC-2 type transport system ATP-binding protein
MIEARSLTKHFGPKVAVDDVSFAVDRGEVLGFLGPNAAGKTTTMRLITGYLPPTAGTAVIGGDDIVQAPLAARKKIGYLPENAPVYGDMTVSGFLGFIAEIRGYSGAERKRRVAETIERCFLSEVRFQGIGTLSKGFRQRVCFAQSVLHDPEYLIMDEPTDGLDPNQKHEVRAMIRAMAENKAIILSTHILEEVEAVCTRAIILAEGKIVANDTPGGLRAMAPGYGVVRFSLSGAPDSGLRAALGGIAGTTEFKTLSTGNGTEVCVHPSNPKEPPVEAIMACLREKGVQVRSFVVDEGRLDEVFRLVTTSAAGKEE